MGYSPPKGRSPTCYSPVRHSHEAPKGPTPVRLACLIRAASVRSEPGSNSPSYCCSSPFRRTESCFLQFVHFTLRPALLSLSILTSLLSSFPIRKKHRLPSHPVPALLRTSTPRSNTGAFHCYQRSVRLSRLVHLCETPETQERIYFTQILSVKY